MRKVSWNLISAFWNAFVLKIKKKTSSTKFIPVFSKVTKFYSSEISGFFKKSISLLFVSSRDFKILIFKGLLRAGSLHTHSKLPVKIENFRLHLVSLKFLHFLLFLIFMLFMLSVCTQCESPLDFRLNFKSRYEYNFKLSNWSTIAESRIGNTFFNR